jgi:hypothetical protein
MAKEMKQLPAIAVQRQSAFFFKRTLRIRSENNSGGIDCPNRFSIGRQPRCQLAPPIKSMKAGMMMLSVLNIHPIRINT